MKNLFPVLLGVGGLMATGFVFMMQRKDKKIKESCGCNDLPDSGNGNNSNMRVMNVITSPGAMVGGVGGGRSASDLERVRPRGIAVVTQSGSDPSNAALFDNIARVPGLNRMNEFGERLRANASTIATDPIVQTANGSHGIVNGGYGAFRSNSQV